MERCVLNGVGKKLRNAYLNGKVSREKITAIYNKNKKEADGFSVFGYRQREIEELINETTNPLLRKKLQDCLENKKELSKKSNYQNKINLEKLYNFKKEACGIGLRKVIRIMKKMSKMSKNSEIKVLTLLLETEYANLSAKQHKGYVRELIYERKSILLFRIASYLKDLGWRYGINDASGKNASYIVYVYLPNKVQLCWHCNEYEIYRHYPPIEEEWDGQVCMTMEKILNYIEEKYLNKSKAA